MPKAKPYTDEEIADITKRWIIPGDDTEWEHSIEDSHQIHLPRETCDVPYADCDSDSTADILLEAVNALPRFLATLKEVAKPRPLKATESAVIYSIAVKYSDEAWQRANAAGHLAKVALIDKDIAKLKNLDGAALQLIERITALEDLVKAVEAFKNRRNLLGVDVLDALARVKKTQ